MGDDKRINEIEERHGATTQGIWSIQERDDGVILWCQQRDGMRVAVGEFSTFGCFNLNAKGNAEFCAKAHSDISYLISELRKSMEVLRWIPLSEKMPPECKTIWVMLIPCASQIQYGVDYWSPHRKTWGHHPGKWTHWMMPATSPQETKEF